jgi:hypothetical protein
MSFIVFKGVEYSESQFILFSQLEKLYAQKEEITRQSEMGLSVVQEQIDRLEPNKDVADAAVVIIKQIKSALGN